MFDDADKKINSKTNPPKAPQGKVEDIFSGLDDGKGAHKNQAGAQAAPKQNLPPNPLGGNVTPPQAPKAPFQGVPPQATPYGQVEKKGGGIKKFLVLTLIILVLGMLIFISFFILDKLSKK